MAKRTKQQIEEDKRLILEKKRKALAELNARIGEMSLLSDEDFQKVNSFINLFLRCEMVYKTLYPEMKMIQENKVIDVRKLTFNVQWFETALRAFGINYDHDKMMDMFASKKSYLVCRNNILHGFDKKSVDEVLAKYDEMRVTMEEFLTNVAKGEPKK